MTGEIVLALRLFTYGESAAWLPDLVLDASVNPLKPEHPPPPKKQSIRKFLVNISKTNDGADKELVRNENPTTNQGATSTSAGQHTLTNNEASTEKEPSTQTHSHNNTIHIKEESELKENSNPEGDDPMSLTSTDLVTKQPSTELATKLRANSRLAIPLAELHIRRHIKPDAQCNQEADLVFDRIRNGANNIYLRVKEGSLSYYYVLTRNEDIIRSNKCMVVQYQELCIFFVHVQNVTERFRMLYKYLIRTLGDNTWITLKKYTNVFISSEPMPTRYHYEVLSKVTFEPPDNVFA